MTQPRSVPLGIAIPQIFLDRPVDMALVQKFVKRAEELDYDSIWVQERIMATRRRWRA